MLQCIFLVDVRKREQKVPVEDFLKLDMDKKVIKSVILSTIGDSYKYYTYKVISSDLIYRRDENSWPGHTYYSHFLYYIDTPNIIRPPIECETSKTHVYSS